jgi:hypothetical protein
MVVLLNIKRYGVLAKTVPAVVVTADVAAGGTGLASPCNTFNCITRLEKSMHQSKETNWRYSGKDKRRPRFMQDDWGLLEDIFEQRQHRIRRRSRRQANDSMKNYEAD